MHVIQSKERRLVLGEMWKQFGITHLVPGTGIKIVKKNSSLRHQCGKIKNLGRLVSYHLQLETLLGAFCCPVPWTLLLLTWIYQCFNTTKSQKVVVHCAQIAPTSVPKNLWYNLNIMNVFIILSILIIVIGVLLIVATPSVLFKFNWNEKTGLEKILVILFYCILLYIINIIYWFINWMWRKKKEHRIFDRIILAVFLLVAFVYTVKFLTKFF